MVSIGESQDEVVKRLSYFEMPPYNPNNLGLTKQGKYIMFDNNVSLLWIKEFPVNVEQFGVLQHEISHCCYHIMNAVGLPLVIECDEAYTYFTEWLTVNIYKRILAK